MALRCSVIALLLCCVGAADSSLLRLPSFLSDHMVLQRGQGAVWGWAAPGEKVQATVKADVAAGGKVLASASATAAS